MPRVKLPDGRVIKFPDGMSPEDMDAALRTLPPREAPTTPPEDASAAEPKSLGGFLGNAVGSLGNLAVGTVQGAAQLGDVANVLFQAPQRAFTDPSVRAKIEAGGQAIRNPGAVANAAKEYFSKRYGGLKEIGETLYTDPAGVAADVATAASLGGAGLARAPGVAGQIGRGLTAVGAAVDPMVNVGRAAGAAAPTVSRGLAKTGELLNASALNVSPTLQARNPGVNLPRLMGEEGLALTKGGESALASKIAGREAELAQVAAATPKTIDPRKVVEPLQALAKERRAAAPGSTPYNEAGDVDRRVQEILRASEGPVDTSNLPDYYVRRSRDLIDERELKPITYPQAREAAIGLNKKIYPKQGAPLTDPILRAEAQGYRGALEGEDRIAELNAELGPLLGLRKATRAATAQAQPLTRADLIRTTIGGGLGFLGGGGIGAVPGMVAGAAMRSPMVKSLAGRELFRLSRNAPGAAAAFEANGPLLTRLALLSQLAPEEGEP